MIKIGHPRNVEDNDCSRVEADIFLGGQKVGILRLEVPIEFAEGLCYDRSDCFVVGLLGYALKHGHDITFDAPITDMLKDSIEHDFVDVVCQHQPTIHHTRLFGQTITPIHKNAEVRAMGLSCGVDCLFTVKRRMLDPSLGDRYFFMTDAHMQSREQDEDAMARRFEPLRQNAEEFAKKMGIPLIVARTNWGPCLLDDLTIINNTTFCNCFAALAMQNLFSRYYLASGGPVVDFAARYLKNGMFNTDCSNYDLLSLGAFSTPSLRFIVDGLEERVKKIESLLEWPDCWDNLDVCEKHYDGHVGNGTFDCHKCMHTVNEILSVGGIEALERFKKTFDVEYVKQHRDEFLAYLVCQRIEKSEVGMEAWNGRAREGLQVTDYARAAYWIVRKTIRKLWRNKAGRARRWVDI